MKKVLCILSLLYTAVSLDAQCVIFCNSNAGYYSENPNTLGYDNMTTAFHSTVATEPTGFVVWGEYMNNAGTGHNLSPLALNSTNYPNLTGSVYYAGVGSASIYYVQMIVLTSTGLFASGAPGAVLSTAIKNTSVFDKITVNGKADGLPSGITPDSVKMMFVTCWSIIITTCGGRVYVLSQDVNIRGGGGVGSATQWVQVMQNSTTPLTGVIAARGASEFGYALKADSTIWTWGDGISLGNGTAPFSSNYAVQMTLPSGISGVKMIQGTIHGASASYFASYFILGTDKKIYSLGMNNAGQLGDNTTTNRTTWVNALNPNSTVINDAQWISANEHDYLYANMGVIKTDGDALTCGFNSTFMIGRSTNNGSNNLNFPSGISASDTILYLEVGGHTTAFIKKNTVRYGYVGHYVNGSLGSGASTNSTLSTVNYTLPPIINICGTRCDTPKIYKKPYKCTDTQAVFMVKSRVNTKILYQINNGLIDSIVVGISDTGYIIVKNPTVTMNLKILKVANIFCELNLSIQDSINKTYYTNTSVSICIGNSYLWNGNYLTIAGSYSDTFVSSNLCDSFVTLNLIVNPTKSSSFSATICSNQSYFWNGINRNTSGSYLDTFLTTLGCDSVVTLNLTVNPTKSSSFTATICSNQSYLWNGINRNTTGSYLDTFASSLGCDSVVTLNLTVNPTKSSAFPITICSNQTYLWNGVNRNTSGAYLDTFMAANGCDSVVTLNLTVNPTKTSSFQIIICSNQSYLWNGVNRNTSGSYIDTFLTTLGCDSVVTLNLTVNPTKSSSFSATICSNQTYLWNGINRNTSGSYLDTFITTLGCDSVVTLNLIVNPTESSAFSETICSNQFFLWNGINRNSTGSYLDTFASSLGCDSVVTLNLTVNPTKSSSFPITICSNQFYLWNGVNRNISGAYLDTFMAANGCDSVVTLNLTSNPTKTSSFPITICSNQSYLWNGVNRNTSGSYIDTFLTTLGCDSVVTLNLTVNPTKSSSFSATICSNQTYLWNGINRNTSGSYLDTFISTLGCDSVVTLNLTVNPTKSSSFSATICSNQTYLWNGTNRNTSGAYLDTFPTTLGCDSVVTLNLTVNPTKSSAFPITICSNQFYLWNGVNRNTTGSYLDTFTAVNGCDSVVTLNLTVNPTKTSSFPITICSNQSYLWNGVNRNTSGSYLDTFATSLGCDSVVTLNLTVNPTKSSSFNATICSNQTYLWNGINRNTTGSYLDTFLTTLGCDSVVTLNLIVNPTKSSSFSATICSNQTYLWNGVNRNTTGSYLDTFASSLGCDSVVTLNLTVNPTKSSSFNATICSNQFYLWNGVNRNTSGVYLDTFTATNGCDSVVTMNLTVNPTKTSSFLITICSNQTYLWNGINRNTSGSYLDTFATSLGCDSIVTLNLTVNPTKNNIIYQKICGGSNYNWNGNILNVSGSYFDTFSTSLGCDSTVELVLTVQPVLTCQAVVIDSLKCFGDTIAKSKANVSGGIQPYSYLWSNGSNKDSAFNLKQGIQTVIVSDSYNCKTYDTLFLTQPDSVSISLLKLDAKCNGTPSGSIKAVASGGTGAFSFLWSNAMTNDSISNLVAGIYSTTITDANQCSKSKSITINELSPIQIKKVTIDSVSCYGGSDGNITTSYIGSKPPYSYQWQTSPTVIDSFLTNKKAGKYILEITDSVQCKRLDTFEILQPDSFTILTTIQNASCYKGSDGMIDVDVNGGNKGYQYSLGSGFQLSSSFTNLIQGNYSLTVKDRKSCSDSVSASISEPAPISTSISSQNSSCIESQNGKAKITSIKGGTSPYSYLWQNGDTLDSANFLIGNKTVVVRILDSNKCMHIDSVFVGFDYALNAMLKVDSASCFKANDGKMTATPMNGFSPYSYSWGHAPYANTDTAKNLIADVYVVTVTDANNCTIIKSDSVKQPSEISSDFFLTEPSCFLNNDGMIVAKPFGGISPYKSYWTISPTIMNDTLKNVSGGMYSIQIMDAHNCIVYKSVYLNQPTQEFFVKVLEKKDLNCYHSNDGLISVDGDGGNLPYTFTWNTIPVSNKQKIENLEAYKNYHVTIKDKNGCGDSMSFVLTEPDPIHLNIKSIVDNVCPKDNLGTIVLNSKGGTLPYYYSIDSFKSKQKNPVFSGLEGGEYIVELRDSNRCYDSIHVNIFKPEEIFLKITPFVDTIDMCSSIQLKSYVWSKSGILPVDLNYQWGEIEGINCIDCADPMINSYVTNEYPLSVRFNNNKCEIHSKAKIFVRGAKDVFIPNSFSPNGDKLNDSFFTYCNCVREKKMSIYNRWGEKLYENTDPHLGWDGRYRGVESPAGVYTYIVYITFLNGEIKKYTGEFMLYR